MKKGDIVKGKITSIKTFGAFVKVNEKIDGLIHISEISNGFVRNIKDYLTVGDEVELEILDISRYNKLSLSYKSLNKNRKKKREKIHLIYGFKPLAEKLNDWIKYYEKKR